MPIRPFDGVPPSREDPENFSPRVDALLSWLLTQFVPDANALEQSLTWTGSTGTSASSLTVGTGVKTLMTQPGKNWIPAVYVYVVSAAAVGNVMLGRVQSYDVDTGELEFDVLTTTGSGTFSDWIIGLSAASLPVTGAMLASSAIADRLGYQPLSRMINAWLNDSGGYERLYLQEIDGEPETTYLRGHGAVPFRFRDGNDSDVLVLHGDGRATLAEDAINPTHIPRFGQFSSRPGHTYGATDWCWLDKTSGLILQWGRTGNISGSTTVTYPVAFTSVSLGGWSTPIRNASETDGNYSGYFRDDGNKTTATVVQDGAGSGSGGSGQIQWFAIGV